MVEDEVTDVSEAERQTQAGQPTHQTSANCEQEKKLTLSVVHLISDDLHLYRLVDNDVFHW